ncbi:MAG TPA: hypothetical protein VMB03_08750 [Bryobacteraceae bacterium]|nr:hypothetical protein [Bryobacteraceae bacterium]
MKVHRDCLRLCPGKKILLLLMAGCTAASAQTNFSSTSTGADGALNLTTPGTVVFNPASFNPPLNPSGNNIFNFTTINIAAGVTVVLSGQNLTGPMYWLAQGAVTIAGTLNLNGQNGAAQSQSEQTRIPAYPGAGGYAGGVGGRQLSTPPLPAQPGGGPGGGAAGTATTNSSGGTFAGSNVFLVPLVGGSGGGGGMYSDPQVIGSGGGAGGGAILIASSTSIAITGSITAAGGFQGTCTAFCGSRGSGGAVRMISPVVTGNGSISAAQIRIETANYSNSLILSTPFVVSSTPNLYLPTTPPGALTVVSVGGVNLPASPTASFSVADATINAPGAVPVVVQANNIPPGTVVTLQFFSESGTDFSVQAPALSGTLTQSTTTAQVTFPAGFTRGYVVASW